MSLGVKQTRGLAASIALTLLEEIARGAAAERYFMPAAVFVHYQISVKSRNFFATNASWSATRGAGLPVGLEVTSLWDFLHQQLRPISMPVHAPPTSKRKETMNPGSDR
jgi:hypothetical protein